MDALGPMAMGLDPVNTLAGGWLQGASGKDAQAAASAATGFESLFMSQVMKEMRQTLDSDGLFGQDGGDVYGGMFDLYLGQHLASAGGFGLGALVKQELEARNGNGSKPTT